MVYLKVFKRVDPKSSHQKGNKIFLYLFEMMDVDQTYCGNHFTINVSQIIMLSTLNLYSAVYQLYPKKLVVGVGRNLMAHITSKSRIQMMSLGLNFSL